MSKPVKVLTISSWALLVVVMISLVASGRLGRRDDTLLKPVIGHVKAFSLIDQDGKAFTSESLQGKIWAADFIFTRCQGPCLIMTDKMGRVQKAVHGEPIRLVSFSVDPEFDTPAVLREYGQRNGENPAQWSLVTGKYDQIQTVARSMLVGLQAATADEPIIHSTHFVLVDGNGDIHGPYNGNDEDGWKELVADANKLIAKQQ